MYEPGLDRHEWESEWQALEDDLREDPAAALPELDGLVARMLEVSGYDLTDPVAGEGDEREVVTEYLAAHEITQGAERDSGELSPGDVAAASNVCRAASTPPPRASSAERARWKRSRSRRRGSNPSCSCRWRSSHPCPTGCARRRRLSRRRAACMRRASSPPPVSRCACVRTWAGT